MRRTALKSAGFVAPAAAAATAAAATAEGTTATMAGVAGMANKSGLRSSAFTPGPVARRARAAILAAAALRPPLHVRAAVGEVRQQLGSPSPSIQVGRPKTSIKKDVGRVTAEPSQPEADAERGSAKARPRRKTLADEMPMFKVILLGDEEYAEGHVVTQLQKTVQINKNEAVRIFQEAQATGSSVVCVVCEEHAEFYAQQLKRQDIFVVVEKDE